MVLECHKLASQSFPGNRLMMWPPFHSITISVPILPAFKMSDMLGSQWLIGQ